MKASAAGATVSTMPSAMPIQKASWKPTFVGFTTPCIRKMGPRPMIMVPEMVVAAMISAPMIMGRLPTMPKMIMNTMPMMRGFILGVRPRMPGRSRAVSFASELNVESSVEPAVAIMMTAIMKNATMPRLCATTTGALEPAMLMPSR
ncbi:hypothetical protein GPA_32380 [Gordonibacter pamelaeae 7-10-1-b]|uniref:Uncharacterized protein n=2 Tax=Gordonibacter pamelaeae TaxID=471189 RepID=D6EBF2_9ACTN|nr:hypothetical protein GPA_32380 [Gordonibacter pamelaeae 7-10-1-b]